MITTMTYRIRNILRAVAAGRCSLTDGCEPDLFVDGVACCDQFSAHELVHAGLVGTVLDAGPHDGATAVLTALGRQALGLEPGAPLPDADDRAYA